MLLLQYIFVLCVTLDYFWKGADWEATASDTRILYISPEALLSKGSAVKQVMQQHSVPRIGNVQSPTRVVKAILRADVIIRPGDSDLVAVDDFVVQARRQQENLLGNQVLLPEPRPVVFIHVRVQLHT